MIFLLFAAPLVPAPESPYTHDLTLGCIVYATLADGLGTGYSSMGDWLSLESWCGGMMGTPPSSIVEAELFLQGINQDGVRDWSDRDIVETFAALDTNDDGVIEIGEPTRAALAGETPVLAQAFVRRSARLLLLERADADRDGVVTESERAVVIDEWTRAQYPSKLVRAWISDAKEEVYGRWSAISPGASFAAFGANLDQDQDGGRIDWLRMEDWFCYRDANGDRTLDAAELFAPGLREASTDVQPRTTDPVIRRAQARILASGASKALREGDVDGAVQRLIGLAWLSPESFDAPGPEAVTARETARMLTLVALPSESKPLISALRLLGIALE